MDTRNTGRSFRTAFLINQYLRGQITETEKTELDKWLAVSEQNQQLFSELCNAHEMEKQLERFVVSNTDEGWQRIQAKLAAKAHHPAGKRNSRIAWQLAAAVLVLALATWQLLQHEFNRKAENIALTSRFGEDVLPGSKKAQLVLHDGTTVQLNTHTDSSFSENGNTVQRMADGALVYRKTGAPDADAGWNTINIPNGGEYMVVLEDGTKVWLNAASSLRYPVQFTGKERMVELIVGEAYFEVAKNKEKPFIVIANRMEVQAIGTAFDVNTYVNTDSNVYTTLTEGRVKVKTRNGTNLLLPGEQVKTSEFTSEVFTADIDEVTAWKNGLFIFNGTALPDVMKHLARWYDVKIEYDKTFTNRKFFTGEIKRNVPVSKLLQMMELTGIAKFRITNNTIIILPYTP